MLSDISAIVAKAAPGKERIETGSPGEEPEGLIAAAEDIMDVLGSYVGGPASDSASKVEKAVRDAERRAKANLLAQALRSFFEIVDSGPHTEGEHR